MAPMESQKYEKEKPPALKEGVLEAPTAAILARTGTRCASYAASSRQPCRSFHRRIFREALAENPVDAFVCLSYACLSRLHVVREYNCTA